MRANAPAGRAQGKLTLSGLLAAGLIACSLPLLTPLGAFAQSTTQFDQLRNRLIEEVLVPGGIDNPRVLKAARDTQRHEFVSPQHRRNAYYDMALPIGEHQTISSPFIVAFMTQSLDPQPTDKVLEIGTGSGYQAAILSPLVKEVYSIEIVEPLGLQAKQLLKRLKYENVQVKVGDGFQGWPEHAPFDKIIVTCSPEKVPQPLVDQLAEGGLMVIPVGERYQQILYLYRKKNGKLEAQPLRPTLFVPMTGKAEAGREVLPDPKNPKAINGNFETPAPTDKYVAGWYYEQQAVVVEDQTAPEGRHFVRFRNAQDGRSAHILQGFGIDGRHVKEIRLSAWIKLVDVTPGPERDDSPNVAITFYDQNRKDLGLVWIGNFKGTKDWQHVVRTFRVPLATREGILRVGLFGATGEACFDDVKIEAVGTTKEE
ncbi:MAG: protein-L-isoaspartate(D-aspartate) O-methyltransferase [Pirellulales bacterium]